MSILNELTARNSSFASTIDASEMPALPKLNSMILTCVDARVDPAHVLGLQLGEAVVFRNNGGSVTRAYIDEVAALAILVAHRTGVDEAAFSIVLMQHTQCGANAFADPALHDLIETRIGADVSSSAITDPAQDLLEDIGRLRGAPHLPGGLKVSALLYEVETGRVREIASENTLAELRN